MAMQTRLAGTRVATAHESSAAVARRRLRLALTVDRQATRSPVASTDPAEESLSRAVGETLLDDLLGERGRP